MRPLSPPSRLPGVDFSNTVENKPATHRERHAFRKAGFAEASRATASRVASSHCLKAFSVKVARSAWLPAAFLTGGASRKRHNGNNESPTMR